MTKAGGAEALALALAAAMLSLLLRTLLELSVSRAEDESRDAVSDATAEDVDNMTEVEVISEESVLVEFVLESTEEDDTSVVNGELTSNVADAEDATSEPVELTVAASDATAEMEAEASAEEPADDKTDTEDGIAASLELVVGMVALTDAVSTEDDCTSALGDSWTLALGDG